MAMEPEELARALGEAAVTGEAGEKLDPNNSAVIRIMAEKPEVRDQLLQLVDEAIQAGGERADRLVAALGERAQEPDIAERILPYAETVPAAAEVAIAGGDLERAKLVAGKLMSDDVRWRAAAAVALRRLSPEDAFDCASPLFVAPDRSKPAGLERLEALVWSLPKTLDTRWLGYLAERAHSEDSPKVRVVIYEALARLGAPAVPVILTAAKDEKDNSVLEAVQRALADIGPVENVVEQVRSAVETSSGKRKRTLSDALEQLEKD